MYRSFRARNYRCFEDLIVEPLERVNLVAGKNNVGKTALLEAVWLHHEYHNPTLAYVTNLARGLSRFKPSEFLWELFRNFDPRTKIELSAIHEEGPASTVTIELPPHRLGHAFADGGTFVKLGDDQRVPQSTVAVVQFTHEVGSDGNKEVYRAVVGQNGEVVNAQPMGEPTGYFLPAHQAETMEWLAERTSDLAARRQEAQLVNILRIIEPRLKDLRVLQQAGTPMIWGDLEPDDRLPLPSLGDGMSRLLRISVCLQAGKGGLLAIDEIENGFHYSVMKKVWEAVAVAASDLDVQVFATTHSEECIRSAHEAFSERENYDFRLHRLEYDNGVIKSVTYDQEALEFALKSGWEVRG
ncbi:MAG: AAA family ATPase [Pseudomonadota bacterium]